MKKKTAVILVLLVAVFAAISLPSLANEDSIPSASELFSSCEVVPDVACNDFNIVVMKDWKQQVDLSNKGKVMEMKEEVSFFVPNVDTSSYFGTAIITLSDETIIEPCVVLEVEEGWYMAYCYSGAELLESGKFDAMVHTVDYVVEDHPEIQVDPVLNAIFW